MSKLDETIKSLNQEQKEAVTHTSGSLLILAGAGAGKTKVITTKIAYLIEKGVAPYKILAVTFTNKAAREMKDRAILLCPESTESSLKTFHSFGAWFLRKFPIDTISSKNFSIYDDTDCVTLLGNCFPTYNKMSLKQLYRKISRAKDDFLLPENISEDSPYFEIKELYKTYQTKLRETGNVDFGDLIMLPVLCLKQNPEIKKHIQNYFNVILVDEFQDSNIAQMELLKELTNEKTYLCVVGDDDQSIYKFRGASISNILSFNNSFTNSQIIKLQKNYRSTPEILAVANSIIKNNSNRLGKELEATRNSGIKPILYITDDQADEAEMVIDLIKNDVKQKNTKYSDWAVLYRMNSQSRNFETSFMNALIPYRIVGSLRFYEREEVKDSISLFKFLLNFQDEVSLMRIINKPPRGIGDVSKQKIINVFSDSFNIEANIIQELNFDNESNTEQNEKRHILERIQSSSLTKKVKLETEKFINLIFSLRNCLQEKKILEKELTLKYSSGLSFFVAFALELSELVLYHKSQDEILDTQKLSNLQELVNMAVNYEFSEDGLLSFLESLSLDADATQQEETSDSVTLITVHGTKGLEFTNVIISGLEENVFPITSGTEEDIEEERRLMYVACTRAKNKLFMTCANKRMWEGRISTMYISRFITEIEEDLFTVKERKERFSLFDSKPKFTKLKKANEKNPILETKWKKGTKVFSDENGYGIITKCELYEDNITFEVLYETNEKKVYFPPYNTSSLEVLASDE